MKALVPTKREKLQKKKVLEDIKTKLDAFTHEDTLQKAGIVYPYPPEWSLIPFSKTYQVPNVASTVGRALPINIFTASIY